MVSNRVTPPEREVPKKKRHPMADFAALNTSYIAKTHTVFLFFVIFFDNVR